MIEAVVVLSVEAFIRGFDDGTRVLRHNAPAMPLPGCICKAVRTGKRNGRPLHVYVFCSCDSLAAFCSLLATGAPERPVL